jgi:hypothetical protein
MIISQVFPMSMHIQGKALGHPILLRLKLTDIDLKPAASSQIGDIAVVPIP